MKKRTKIAAGLFFLGILGVTGAYGYFSDTLQVVNHISVGDIKISVEEYEKKGTKEVPYRNTGEVLPGAVVSKIPRITNHALPCWVRARNWKVWMIQNSPDFHQNGSNEANITIIQVS